MNTKSSITTNFENNLLRAYEDVKTMPADALINPKMETTGQVIEERKNLLQTEVY